MEAYTKPEFINRYAPVTGKTKRWGIAPPAPYYCEQHVNKRASVLRRVGVTEESVTRMAKSPWLHLHPEVDFATRRVLGNWLETSKLLYAYEHPKNPYPEDPQFFISEIYCVSNKVISYVGKNGIAATNRWTYNHLNSLGSPAGNRRLLVHGAPLDNIAAILDHDLMLSGFEVRSTSGQMLGEGLYVADSFIKSMQYARAGLVDGRETKVLFLVEVNVGVPMTCLTISWNDTRRDFEHTYEEDYAGATRKDITVARGKRFFSNATRLNCGWASGCRVPITASREQSSSPCTRINWGNDEPLKFNEWCVHNTQLYSIAYMILLQKREDLQHEQLMI